MALQTVFTIYIIPIDFAFLAIPNHFQKFFSFPCERSSDTFICVNLYKLPFGVFHNGFCIMRNLRIITFKLIFAICRDTTICSHSQNTILTPSFLLQRVGFNFCYNFLYLCLITHNIPLMYSPQHHLRNG